MFIIELQANDMHAALGRLLDQTRVHDLRIGAVSARMIADGCRITASLRSVTGARSIRSLVALKLWSASFRSMYEAVQIGSSLTSRAKT